MALHDRQVLSYCTINSSLTLQNTLRVTLFIVLECVRNIFGFLSSEYVMWKLIKQQVFTSAQVQTFVMSTTLCF